MSYKHLQPEDGAIEAMPKIDVPPDEELSPEQSARREEAIQRILRRRAERGQIGIAADELKHLARAEHEE